MHTFIHLVAGWLKMLRRFTHMCKPNQFHNVIIWNVEKLIMGKEKQWMDWLVCLRIRINNHAHVVYVSFADVRWDHFSLFADTTKNEKSKNKFVLLANTLFYFIIFLFFSFNVIILSVVCLVQLYVFFRLRVIMRQRCCKLQWKHNIYATNVNFNWIMIEKCKKLNVIYIWQMKHQVESEDSCEDEWNKRKKYDKVYSYFI